MRPNIAHGPWRAAEGVRRSRGELRCVEPALERAGASQVGAFAGPVGTLTAALRERVVGTGVDSDGRARLKTRDALNLPTPNELRQRALCSGAEWQFPNIAEYQTMRLVEGRHGAFAAQIVPV